MNGVLLDSHILIWLLFKPERLSLKTREIIKNSNACYISVASLWELLIKYKKGKLVFTPEDILSGYKNSGLKIMPIHERHLASLEQIRLSHKDPFDELLVAQSIAESIPLLTADHLLIKSPYQTINAR